MNRRKTNPNIRRLLSWLLLVALPAVNPASAFAGVNEFWISPQAQPVGASLGTKANPFDGSTVAKFDAAMQAMPSHALIHLGSGTFHTLGDHGWGPKTGQQLMGGGMDVTILQFPSNSVVAGKLFNGSVIAVQSPYMQTNIMISDMTLDCNYQTGTMTTLGGLGLFGSGNTVERVKLINAASFTTSITNYHEAWGIILAAWPYPAASGNLIENCVISGYRGNFNNNLSAMGLLENNSGVVAHNTIIQNGGNKVFGIYPGSHNSTMDGNVLSNLSVGSHYDSGTGVTNDLIINNKFINCSAAIDWANGYFCDTIISNNEIVLTNDGSGAFSTEAFYFHPPPSAFKNIKIIGNTIRTTGNYPGQRFILAYTVNGIQIQNNEVASNLPCLFFASTGIVMTNNFDWAGKPYGVLPPPLLLGISAK